MSTDPFATMPLPGTPELAAAEPPLATIPGPRSLAVLGVLWGSTAASWSLCARGLGLSWQTVLTLLLASLAGLGICLGSLSLRGLPASFLRRLARAAALVGVVEALLSLALKAGWFPEHAGWGGLFLALLPVAVGGLAWMAWQRLGWLRPPLPAAEADADTAADAVSEEKPRLAQSA